MLAASAVAVLCSSSSAVGSAPLGAGKTVVFGLTRSGSAGAAAGACGTRLQCLKNAITEAASATAPSVEQAGLLTVNVADPDQDVNFKLSGKQFLITPDADPNLSGKADLAEAVSKVSLGGGTCYTCSLQAAKRILDSGAGAGSEKVIVLVAERANMFASTGFTSSGTSTGYPPMTLAGMVGQFDANTVIHAYAVGPDLTCDADPYGYGSLRQTAAVTPGGVCRSFASFEGLGAVLIKTILGGATLAPPPLSRRRLLRHRLRLQAHTARKSAQTPRAPSGGSASSPRR